jgi:hypothetical protein
LTSGVVIVAAGSAVEMLAKSITAMVEDLMAFVVGLYRAVTVEVSVTASRVYNGRLDL